MTHSPHANFSDSFAKRVLIYLILLVGLVFGALNAVGAFGYGHETPVAKEEVIFKGEKVVERPAALNLPSQAQAESEVDKAAPQAQVVTYTSADFYDQATKSFVSPEQMSDVKTYLDVISAKKISTSSESMPLTGTGITIGIVDSGVNTKHDLLKDFNNNSRLVSQGCSGSDNSISLCDNNNFANVDCAELVIGCYHGTAVVDLAAGKRFKISIAGRTNTFTGGVAPDANISFSRVTLSEEGKLDETVMRDGLQKFLNDVNANSSVAPDVVNISIGFPRDGKYSNCNADSEIKNIIDALVSRGVTVVASSGNSGDKSQIMYPACLSNVIAVGASEYSVEANSVTNEKVADYSQSSDDVDLVAPGSDLLTSLPSTNRFSYVKGTSFATPIVTGAIALLKQANPNLSPGQIQSLLSQGADKIVDPATGKSYSRINVLKTLKLIYPNAQ